MCTLHFHKVRGTGGRVSQRAITSVMSCFHHRLCASPCLVIGVTCYQPLHHRWPGGIKKTACWTKWFKTLTMSVRTASFWYMHVALEETQHLIIMLKASCPSEHWANSFHAVSSLLFVLFLWGRVLFSCQLVFFIGFGSLSKRNLFEIWNSIPHRMEC